MSTIQAADRFICSFCEQVFRISTDHIGRRANCRHCSRCVWIYANHSTPIDAQLGWKWFYKKSRLLRSDETVGPVSSEEMLSLDSDAKIYDDTSVSSPEATAGKWVEWQTINHREIKARIEQQMAERERLQRVVSRREQAKSANQSKLQRAISSAVSDGTVTIAERKQLLDFAAKIGIAATDVSRAISEEAEKLVSAVIEESLSDGILDNHERARIGQLADSLGIKLNFTEEQNSRLHLCHLAHQLASGTYAPSCTAPASVALTAKEVATATATFVWLEIIDRRKANSIALEGGYALDSLASGQCLLTTKRVLLLSKLTAKKFTLSSVAQVTRYSDGILFNRTTGKSVFLRPTSPGLESEQWAMLVEHAVTGAPVLGTVPASRFIPPMPDKSTLDFSSEPDGLGLNLVAEPRYTFRVVGDHIGQRRSWIERLSVGDVVELNREPENAYDSNAVAVHDQQGRELGYLKREVAEWFAPILDRGRRYDTFAFRKPESGGLIVGVFE